MIIVRTGGAEEDEHHREDGQPAQKNPATAALCGAGTHAVADSPRQGASGKDLRRLRINKTPARFRAGVMGKTKDADQADLRLRQRAKAAPPISNAAAAQVPGSGMAAAGVYS
jgi:hypothetical protein